jgi:hypothetical protein
MADPATAPSTFEQVLAQERAGLGAGPEGARALCISGGGIRSATFALGAIQELARRGLLGRFDYLSTVSGGGYVGSWLSAWIHRAGGVEPVAAQLRAAADPAPVEHLREFNNYLTPRLGVASPDAWTLGAIVVRNMLLNWLLLLPLLMAALMAPRLMVSLLQVCPPGTSDPFRGFDILQAGLVVAGLALYAFSTFAGFDALPSLGNRGLTQAQFVRRCLVPQLLSGFLLIVGFWWMWDDLDRVPTFPEFAGAGVALSGAGWLAHLAVYDLFRDGRRFARRLFGPLSLACLVFGFCSGSAAYLLTHHLFRAAENDNDPSFFATFAPVLFLGGLVLGQVLAAGFTSRTLGEADREWGARAGAFTLLALFGWLALCGVVLVVPHLALGWGSHVHSVLAAVGGAAGWFTAFPRGRSPGSAPADAGAPSGLLALARRLALPVFVLLLMLGLTVLTNGILAATGAVDAPFWDHHELVENTSLPVSLGLAAALLLFGLAMGRYIDVNTFSLHGMYRDRLVRAYVAASNTGREPSAFTGFSQSDDVPLERLRNQRPLHVLNLTLNLVSGRRLAWQQRKAESFTASPWHVGSRGLGYRDAAGYGGPRGMTLGTAMTISGAAASPNMGYHSSPLVGFTMMLLNGRLGAWLGNPGTAGDDTWRQAGPRSALAWVVRETLGLTDDRSPYVYLSDGGHFENLALYEMVARRCRNILVLDGGCDPDFSYEDLGNALRKVRIDLGVPIEFDSAQLAALRDRRQRGAVGHIRYSEVDGGGPAADGRLVYLKPMVLGDEPPDVQSYAAAHPAFPHETTSNQWFNESQTESYRMLGQHTVAAAAEWLAGAER